MRVTCLFSTGAGGLNPRLSERVSMATEASGISCFYLVGTNVALSPFYWTKNNCNLDSEGMLGSIVGANDASFIWKPVGKEV